MRYFEITRFQVKPGHDKDFEKLIKLAKTGYDKIPDSQWACYESAYGTTRGLYLFFSPHKAASEIDRGFANDKQFEEAVGEDGMKQLEELSATAIESSESNLYAFNPRMSYVADDWIKADAEFWSNKTAVATVHKKKGATEAAKQ